MCEGSLTPLCMTPVASPRDSTLPTTAEVQKDNFPVSVGAKHNFVAIYNYLRDIRYMRGKDRGDLSPKRVLSSMQSPLRAIRESRVKSRYEKELKNSPSAYKKTPSFASDSEYVESISEETSKEADGEFLNQLYHRKFSSSGFDWYSLLKKFANDEEWARPVSNDDEDSRKSIRMVTTRGDAKAWPLPSPSSSPVPTSKLDFASSYDPTKDLLAYGITSSPPSDPTSPSFSASSSYQSPTCSLSPRALGGLSGVFDTISLDGDDNETPFQIKSEKSALKKTKHAVDKIAGTLIKHGTSFTNLTKNGKSGPPSTSTSYSNLQTVASNSSLPSTPKTSEICDLTSFDELIFSDEDDDVRFNKSFDFD
eukprot:TRINITY_DN51_c0_g5_i1.p1 TRINITY_DN51_c0_g5~~TRINITY_DN51_c0_g5_i1.p1  ORF type:complete len:365 (+),score=87.30 TRINITY_DN51_c0_g5_i1:1123-2217(+)